MEKENVASEPTRGPGKNKRKWTNEEEAKLVDVLYETASIWRVKNCFKVGGYAHFEKLLDEKFPGYGLKADPHIISKVKMLKRQHGYIMEIRRGCSGFGWDEERKMVTGDRETYMRWAKNREQAGPLYMKPFAHFDKLCEIFSKERANDYFANDLLANDDLANGDRAHGPEEKSIMLLHQKWMLWKTLSLLLLYQPLEKSHIRKKHPDWMPWTWSVLPCQSAWGCLLMLTANPQWPWEGYVDTSWRRLNLAGRDGNCLMQN